jgi:hypothetical protein
LHKEIENCKKHLSDQVKNSAVKFKDVLEMREELKHVTSTMEEKLRDF